MRITHRDSRRSRFRLGFPLSLLLLLAVALSGSAGAAEPLPGIEETVAGLEKKSGLLTLHVDAARGKVMLELPPPPGPQGHRFLYIEGLASGLGSNPVGLDRSQLGPTRVVELRRAGGKLLIVHLNQRFRARTDDVDERRAVQESFADSVLWGGEIIAEGSDGSVLVDITSFIVSDAHDSVATLESTEQGSFSLAADRSAVDLDALLVFPDNVELEALLTFTSSRPGNHVRATAPTPESMTLRQHHSFVKLPDDGYRPRRFDPRAGSFAVEFSDYAVPLDEPIEQRWIVRHRMRPGKPLVYYLDRGAPEPVRSALLDGARWWAEAFAAAGFPDGYRVEMLPEGAHPLDARYNVIQWVHRSTRGWSYGDGIIDPRTGEMIKGHVLLGSLRVRQDRLLFEGLTGVSKTGTGEAGDPVQVALARIRQLSAHEVGHTLGFSHNFAASTYGRASVMDYPAPLVRITADGALDLEDAYAVGAGSWDILATRYAYTEFADAAAERAGLEAIVQEGIAGGMLFLTDSDARPPGAAHPLANLWDNGADPVETLVLALDVRRIALRDFDEGVIHPGTPLARMQEVLVPVYLHHRFQLDAALKSIGGVSYSHAVRDDGQVPLTPVAPSVQRRALEAVLGILDPEMLDLPDAILDRLPPRPPGHGRNRELFSGRTSPLFDPVSAAEVAASMVIQGVLQPERAARMVDQHRRDERQPSFQLVIDSLVARTFDTPAGTLRHAVLQRATQKLTVEGLIRLAAAAATSGEVRAHADTALKMLHRRLTAGGEALSPVEQGHRAMLARSIEAYREGDADELGLSPLPPAPPGSPIGTCATR